MKKIILALIFISSSAFALTEDLHGSFVQNKMVNFHNYKTKTSCLKDRGHWSKGRCKLLAYNAITINNDGHGTFAVEVTTFGVGANACQISGNGELINPVQLLVRGTNDCEVTVGLTSPTTAWAQDNGKCADYCEAQVNLSIDQARRQK